MTWGEKQQVLYEFQGGKKYIPLWQGRTLSKAILLIEPWKTGHKWVVAMKMKATQVEEVEGKSQESIKYVLEVAGAC